MTDSFWKGVFQDTDGGFSFKRVQTGLFTLLFALVTVTSLFSKLTLPDNILDLLSALLFYGYTGIVAEKFAKKTPTGAPQ